MKSKEIADTVFVNGLHNFDNYDTLNSLKFKLEQDKILRFIEKYNNKRFIYTFLVEGLIFSNGITNDVIVLFITCNDLSNAPETIMNNK